MNHSEGVDSQERATGSQGHWLLLVLLACLVATVVLIFVAPVRASVISVLWVVAAVFAASILLLSIRRMLPARSSSVQLLLMRRKLPGRSSFVPAAESIPPIEEDELPATMHCPACSHMVSTAATTCPHCGHPLQAGQHVASRRDQPMGAWLAAAGGLLMAVGSFLPWASLNAGLFSVSRNGMQLGENLSFSSDGLITLLLGIVTLLIGLSTIVSARTPSSLNQASFVVGGICLALTIYDAVGIHRDFVSGVASEDMMASLGYGLWVIMAGCVLAVSGALLSSRQ